MSQDFFTTFRTAIDKAEDHVAGLRKEIEQLKTEKAALTNDLKRTQQELLAEQADRNALDKIVAKVTDAVNGMEPAK